jgi:hypothetical protein
MCGKLIVRGRDHKAFERAKFCSKDCYWKNQKGKKSNSFKPELHTDEKVQCACGCGALIPKLDKKYRIRLYANGHAQRGRKRPDMIEPFSKIRLVSKKEKHWNWKGGKTPINHLLRNSVEYNNWRKAVYRRDKWTCQMCGEKQKHPIAHHLKPFNDYMELRFEINNGITLCRSCHKKIHKEIGLLTRFI